MPDSPPPGGPLVVGPVFLRKLPRKADWNPPDTPPERRVRAVVEKVFLCDPNPYSLYRVESDNELRRVSVGYNGVRDRDRLHADLDWLTIRADELAAADIEPTRTAGTTLCGFANARHYDIPADAERLAELCRALIAANRPLVSLRKGRLKPWVETGRTEGCPVHPGSTGCTVSECLAVVTAG